MEYSTLNNGVKMPMAGIGTFLLKPDYTSTPDMLKKYAEIVPPVDEQK